MNSSRKIWLLILCLIASTGCAGTSPDHTREQGQQPEPAGSKTYEAVLLDRQPPAFMPSPTTTTSTTTPVPTPQPVVEVVTPTGDVWWALFGCETGQTYNPRIVSKSGRYRGAFQFDLETWHGIGEIGDPIDYPYEHQLAAAQRLHAARGWSPWPTCARKLGLI